LNYKALPLLFIVFSINAQQLTVGADLWKNLTHEDGSGIYFELINKIFGKENIDIQIDSYHRSLNAFHSHKLDIMVGVFREDVSNAILPNWLLNSDDPILAFYRKSDTHISSINDLKKLSNAWVRGYHFERFLSLKANDYPVNTPQDGFKLLAKGRIDVFIDYLSNVPEKHHQLYNHIEILPPRHVYLAFQKNLHGQSLARKFDQAMKQLRESGELARIYGKAYKKSGLEAFKEEKLKMVILTDEANLLRDQKDIKLNDTLSKSLNTIFDQLNNYNFEFKIIDNFANLSQYKNEESLCLSDMIKTPKRLEHFIYSEPSSLYLGLQVYSKSPLPNARGEVNLLKLLNENAELKLGIVQGRSYGKVLDQQIAMINKSQLVTVPSQLDRIMTIFAHNRFNLLLEYPQDIDSIYKQISEQPLNSYTISGGESYILGHMMCTKTVENRVFIDAFNQALINIANSGSLLKILSSSVADEQKQRFTKYFNETYQFVQKVQ